MFGGLNALHLLHLLYLLQLLKRVSRQRIREIGKVITSHRAASHAQGAGVDSQGAKKPEFNH